VNAWGFTTLWTLSACVFGPLLCTDLNGPHEALVFTGKHERLQHPGPCIFQLTTWSTSQVCSKHYFTLTSIYPVSCCAVSMLGRRQRDSIREKGSGCPGCILLSREWLTCCILLHVHGCVIYCLAGNVVGWFYQWSLVTYKLVGVRRMQSSAVLHPPNDWCSDCKGSEVPCKTLYDLASIWCGSTRNQPDNSPTSALLFMFFS